MKGLVKWIGATLAAIACASPLSAQIFWSENFTYPLGTAIGANLNTANPANDWTTVCPTCLAGDWYYVRNNVLEGLDTNGPATMETEVIDITAYPQGVEVLMNLSEAGGLEGCPGGISPGCNNVDWIRVEYQLNGGAYVDVSSPLGGPCNGACAGAVYYTYGDFGSTSVQICPLTGSSLRLRITVQCWAADEYLRIDNIQVQGQTCSPILQLDSLHHVSCNGGNDGFIWVQTLGGATPFTYSIDGINFGFSPQFNNLSAGTYTITLQDANNNQSTLTGIVVTEPAALSASITTLPITCSGLSNGQINVSNPSGGNGPYAFAVDTPPFSAATNFQNLALGPHDLLMQDANGCIDTIPFTISQNSPFSLNTSSTTSACTSSTGTVTVQASGGAPGLGGYTYLWNSSPTQSSLTATGLAIGTYIVTVTDSLGCSDTASIAVGQASFPTVNASPADSICFGQGSAQLSATGGSGPGPFTFTWSCASPSCPLDSLVDNDPLATPGSSSTFFVQATDNNGCLSGLDSVRIHVLSLPQSNAGSNDSICPGPAGTPGASAQLLGNGIGSGPFQFAWSCPATVNPCPLDSLDDNDPLASPTANAVFYLQVTDNFGCVSGLDSVAISIMQPLPANAGTDASICPGDSLQLQASGTGPGPFSFAWHCPATVNPCPLDSLNDDDPIAGPVSNALTLYVQATNGFGCLSLLDSMVIAMLPVPVADAGMGDTVCPGDPVQLLGNGSGAGPQYAYLWSGAGSLSANNIPDPVANPIQPTWYYLTVSSNGCESAPDSVLLETQYAPEALAGNDTVICLGDTAILHGLVNGLAPTHTLEWTGPNGLLNPNGNTTVLVAPVQSTEYVLIAYPPAGCKSLPDTAFVEVELPFVHAIPGNPTSCLGEPLEIGVPSQAGFLYSWSPIPGLDHSDVSLTSLIGTEPVLYTLTVTDTSKQSLNCRTQSYPVLVAPQPCLFPNAISPNNDGINDFLDLGDYYHDVAISIFDRWGNRVYQSDHYQNDWRGTTQSGTAVPDGVYYYFLQANILPSNATTYKLSDYQQAYPLTLMR